MKVALFFGSFNPIHVGHLIIAQNILNQNLAEHVWFVLSPQNPFKSQKDLLDENNRKKMLEKTIKKVSAFSLCDIEFSLEKPSYTYITMQKLVEQFPEHDFAIAMGSDSFNQIQTWKNADELISKYQFIVYERPEHPLQKIENIKFKKLEGPLLNISSSYIRSLIARGKLYNYLIPSSVEKLIQKNKWYSLSSL